jgi:hypothetical protein
MEISYSNSNFWKLLLRIPNRNPNPNPKPKPKPNPNPMPNSSLNLNLTPTGMEKKEYGNILFKLNDLEAAMQYYQSG